MSEKAPVTESKPAGAEAPTTPTPPRRSPGHRGQDVRDTVAEMAAKAHEISLEAGSKMAAAMKDVINAAAGLTGFAVESARDLVQYMVRRGQMTQDEADKLIREAEQAHAKKAPGTKAAARPLVVATADHRPHAAPSKSASAGASAATSSATVKASTARTVAAAKPAAKAATRKAAAPAKKPQVKGAVKRPATAKASAKPAKKK